MMKRLMVIFAAGLLGSQLCAAELGDDGLHKADWMRDTFKDLREDLEEANALGLRLLILIEQRGCIYCNKMHKEVFSDPEIKSYIQANYFVVQINMFGDVEVTDFDGTTLPEKKMVKRWGALFTPTMLFLPQEVGDAQTAFMAAVANMPGAFSINTTRDLMSWIVEKGYDGEETFQKYHARKILQ